MGPMAGGSRPETDGKRGKKPKKLKRRNTEKLKRRKRRLGGNPLRREAGLLIVDALMENALPSRIRWTGRNERWGGA